MRIVIYSFFSFELAKVSSSAIRNFQFYWFFRRFFSFHRLGRKLRMYFCMVCSMYIIKYPWCWLAIVTNNIKWYAWNSCLAPAYGKNRSVARKKETESERSTAPCRALSVEWKFRTIWLFCIQVGLSFWETLFALSMGKCNVLFPVISFYSRDRSRFVYAHITSFKS